MIHFIKVIAWMLYTLPREYAVYSAEVSQHRAWPWQSTVIKEWELGVRKEFIRLLGEAEKRYDERNQAPLDGEMWSIDPTDVPPTDKLN